MKTDSDSRGLIMDPHDLANPRGPLQAVFLKSFGHLPPLPPVRDEKRHTDDVPVPVESMPTNPEGMAMHCAREFLAEQQSGERSAEWSMASLGTPTQGSDGDWTIEVRTKLPGIGKGPMTPSSEDYDVKGKIWVQISKNGPRMISFLRS